MSQCWSESPLSRPTFGTARSIIEKMIEGNSYLAVDEIERFVDPQCVLSKFSLFILNFRKLGSGEEAPLLPTEPSSEEKK